MKPTQLPSGAWRCQVYLGKDPTGKKIFKSITKVNKHDCVIEAEKLAKHHHESERDQSLLTFEEAIDKYLALKSYLLSPCTIRSYENIKKHHLQMLMPMQLKSLNKTVVQRAINEESAKFSPKTVINIYGLITAVLNQFTDQKIEIQLKPKEEKDVNIWSDEQILTFIIAIQGERSEIPLLIALFLGLRRSEIMALEHSDFDLESNILFVTKAMVPDKDNNFVIKAPKTKKGRRKISVPPYLAEKLRSCVDRGERFYNVSPSMPYKCLQKICEKYQLPQMSLHGLRHQNASIMLALNIPDKYAMERGGWASNQVMKNIYQHTIQQQRKEADKTMNNYFEQLIQNIS